MNINSELTTGLSIHRGEILHFLSNPNDHSDSEKQESYQYFEDGILIIKDGLVEACGQTSDLLNTIPNDVVINHHKNALITPGFVDTHIHYPQCEVIASYGEQLLEWLETYTFPAELKFDDPEHALSIARFFLDQLLSNGTTTALVFGTVHPQSVDAFFTEAQAQKLRMICGKVMMDRHAPEGLLDTPESSYTESRALIEKWHNKDRLRYAVTPRLFAHGIYLEDDEWQRLAESDSALSFCPRSNLFIGSGLFNINKANQFKVKTGLGTDVGGGDSFSILQTINEAYKVQQLQGNRLSAFESLYLATLGGALALDLHNEIGNFESGKEADFVILDYHATKLMKFKLEQCNTIEEKLFSLLMLGDDRCIRETHILGKKYIGKK